MSSYGHVPSLTAKSRCIPWPWMCLRVQHSEGHSGGGGGCNPGVPCTPGRHRVGCQPDIPFVQKQLTTLGRWGHRDAALRANETRLAATICSRAHVADWQYTPAKHHTRAKNAMAIADGYITRTKMRLTM
ncbi:hypothetical protein HaLaN_09090 [Haematococcus lacustris]|uniref:Uncharacterized protein n=1 Tax=Haematococcus lacustris TaxID=44745 RepID=A0A699YSR4_HAELA|nr:hypothetical protein HaLaN_09090 [Haematococcus lacustris]